MEPNTTGKFPYILTGVLLTACVAGVLAFFAFHETLPKVPLSELTRKDLPMLDLRLQFVSFNGEQIPPEQVRLRGALQEPKQKGLLTEPDEKCPELKGGDLKNPLDLSDVKSEAECPRVATWQVVRHPIAFSLYFQDPAKFLALFDDDTLIRELFQSKFIQGVFYDPLHSASVRAEDLRLEGLQGAFFKQFIRESLSAHAELHYDIVHGKRGIIYSFIRDECPFASRALPLMGRVLARSGYKIPTLDEPIIEMRIGVQRLFLTQYGERVYLANSLESLLNALENIDVPRKNLPKAPLVLTVRGEAFFQKLLPVMAGSRTFEANLGLDPSGHESGILQLPSGKYSRHLHPQIFKGVLAAIPNDTFSAVVTSFYLPPDTSNEQWQQFAADGPGEQSTAAPEEAGLAIIWDVEDEGNQISSMGVIIANQTTPDDADKFKRYFSNPELTAECGGGTVFLAASSRNLLTRMKESCSGQSLSVLDWERGTRKAAYEKSQLLLFMNLGTGMREIFLAGGARSGDLGEFEPQWKQQYEQAKEVMRAEGEKVFKHLPVIGFSGPMSPAATADTMQLNGFTVKQGALR